METLEIIKQTLLNAYLFDIDIFSNKWMYYPLCIPAFFYTAFFMLKWVVLTAPVWLPIRMVLNAFDSTLNRKNKIESELSKTKIVNRLLDLIESKKL